MPRRPLIRLPRLLRKPVADGADADSAPGRGIGISIRELMLLRRDAAVLKSGRRRHRRGVPGGLSVSAFRGRGMEFHESRRYIAGDDFRDIDWRGSARTGHLHTKVYREEREQALLIVYDASASMRFGTRRVFKQVAAAEAAALAAWAACDDGDRVGAFLHGHDQAPEELRPGTGEHAVVALLRSIQSSCQAPGGEDAGAQRSHLADALVEVERVVRPGSDVLVIGDFIGAGASVSASLGRLSRHNLITLMHVSDPMERALPHMGICHFGDRGRLLRVDTSDSGLGDGFTSQFDAHRTWLQGVATKTGAALIEISTDRPVQGQLHSGLWRGLGRRA